jgi:hypothetical protein
MDRFSLTVADDYAAPCSGGGETRAQKQSPSPAPYPPRECATHSHCENVIDYIVSLHLSSVSTTKSFLNYEYVASLYPIHIIIDKIACT